MTRHRHIISQQFTVVPLTAHLTGALRLREFPIQPAQNVRHHPLTEDFQRIVIRSGNVGIATDSLFQTGQTYLFFDVAVPFLRQRRVTEIKSAVGNRLRMLQYSIEHLQLRNALTLPTPKPRDTVSKLLRDGFQHTSVTAAQNADEIRTAFINLAEANGQHLPVDLLLLRNTPTQVNAEEGYPSLGADSADFGRKLLIKIGSLPFHIRKRRRQKHPDNRWHPVSIPIFHNRVPLSLDTASIPQVSS